MFKGRDKLLPFVSFTTILNHTIYLFKEAA